MGTTPVPERLRQRTGSVGAATCSTLRPVAPGSTDVAAGGGPDLLLGTCPSTEQD